MKLKQQAIAAIQSFNPYSGPLFETEAGMIAIEQQAAAYAAELSAEVLSEIIRLAGRARRLNERRSSPRDLYTHTLLEGAAIDLLEPCLSH